MLPIAGDETAADRRMRRALQKGHQMASRSSITGHGKLAVATLLALGMLTTASHAYTFEQQQMCSGDAMRLCGSEIPNVSKVTACMRRNRSNLSTGCRTVMDRELAQQSKKTAAE